MKPSQNIRRQQVIIDCQVLQTSDRARGMGFFLRCMMASLPQENPDFDWVFILNERLPRLTSEDVEIIKKLNGRLVHGAFLHSRDKALFDEAAPANRVEIDRILHGELSSSKQSIFFIPAMFCREIYPVFPTGMANMMLFHDLIPFLYPKQYFRDYQGPELKDYAQRFREVYKTDLFVTNSQTTADDLTIYCGVDPSRIMAILGAAAVRKRAKAPVFAEKLETGFVFMPSGDDYRKNNTLAVQAFDTLHTKRKLVMSSSFGPESQRALKKLCPSIIFAGNIPDAEMLWLFKHADAVFFPSQYEGLGMPLLEAVEVGTPIACSNISVFVEISPTAFHFFDPSSVTSMAEKLSEALDSANTTTQSGEYSKIIKSFSWQKTARLFIKAIEMCQPAAPKERLAILCPSPASYSSVGKYAFETHAELSRMYQIDYFMEHGHTAFEPVRPNLLEYAADCYKVQDFDYNRSKHYDRVIYHIGNSEFHVNTILNALRIPADAIVHDTMLNGIFDYMVNHHFMAPERRLIEEYLDSLLGCSLSKCLTSLVTYQKNLFCHSEYALKAISENGQIQPPRLHKVAHPIGVPAVEPRHIENPVISFAGIISEDKGIHLVSEIGKIPDVSLKIFGFGVLGGSPLLAKLGPNTQVLVDLTDKEFQDALMSTDILINYRPNYHGETSRSALEAMRYGTVVIVKNIGWFAELPDEVVVKVDSEIDVLAAIRRLINNPDQRREIGRKARAYLTEQYSYKKYAEEVKREGAR